MLLQGKTSLARKKILNKIEEEMKISNHKVMKKKGRKTKKAAEIKLMSKFRKMVNKRLPKEKEATEVNKEKVPIESIKETIYIRYFNSVVIFCMFILQASYMFI
jgi:hypothetical protein